MTSPKALEQGPKYLEIMHGGPFFEWQAAAGLLTPTCFRSARRCGLILALTLGVPILLLSLARSDQLTAFLADPSVWAKFAIAPVLFILAEPRIEQALDVCAQLFFGLPLFADPSAASVGQALSDVRARRKSKVAEAICLLLALAITCLNIWILSEGTNTFWAEDKGALTFAGWFCLLFSSTMVWFLLLRLAWRHVIWALFLRAVSKADLRLVVSHPDGHAGMGFVSAYPSGYVFFNLGAGAIVAAGLARELHRGTLSLTAFSAVCTLWLVIVTGYFALPLVGFIRQIIRLKTLTITLSLGPILHAERDDERSKLGCNAFPEPLAPDGPPATDAVPIYKAAVKCSSWLLNKSNIFSILLTALLPLAAVGLTVFPYKDLVPVLKHLLLM